MRPFESAHTRGAGIASLPDYAIDEWLADYRLLVVLPGAEESSGYFRAMWPSPRT
ncbi:hypothetical protein C7408_102350 [Paraburkholderia caballeronis]|nr:hypothetical protein C7408_102350 [Paraburkholderia caballeronis]TDV22205.1 hypothetical protein C7406_101350 [Paraburkholderia caballeronis]TDV29109.1 hypothetical protein C7404_102351 [Paraburkholderia caballeronis]